MTVAIGQGAVVDTSLAAALASPSRRVLQGRTSQVVTAYTAKGKVTAEALRGEPGVLVAARVTRPGGTTTVADGSDPDPASQGIGMDDEAELDPPPPVTGTRRSGV